MSLPLSRGEKCLITFTVNGVAKNVSAYPMERLLDVLRRDLALTGTKEGCGEGECGSCSVLMDGVLVNSCLIPAGQASGTSVVTIEGLAVQGGLHPVQQAFLDCGGAQCPIPRRKRFGKAYLVISAAAPGTYRFLGRWQRRHAESCRDEV
jgi:xanthine dehydrogenase iron-sulfur cluster and FAD-binding subunit A